MENRKRVSYSLADLGIEKRSHTTREPYLLLGQVLCCRCEVEFNALAPRTCIVIAFTGGPPITDHLDHIEEGHLRGGVCGPVRRVIGQPTFGLCCLPHQFG